MRALLTVAAVVALPGSIRADILPPGHKSVSHDARFENVKDYPDYVFYMGPCHTDFARAYPRLSEGGEVGLGGNPLAYGGGQFLFAVPKSVKGEPEEAWFEGKVEGVLKSERLVYPIRSAPVGEGRKGYLTRYSVAIADGKLTLTQLPDEQPGFGPGLPLGRVEGGDVPPEEGSPRWMIAGGLGLAAVLAAVGLIVTRGRRRND
jgi:hypothetical protein